MKPQHYPFTMKTPRHVAILTAVIGLACLLGCHRRNPPLIWIDCNPRVLSEDGRGGQPACAALTILQIYPHNEQQPPVYLAPNTLEASAYVVRGPGGQGIAPCGNYDFRLDSYIIRPKREGEVVTIGRTNFTSLPAGFYFDQIQIKIPPKNER